jgi:hypothetical protein
MASTLSYGFEKPATGDKGSVFWPILESNIQKTNDHTHNGSNSSRLTAASSVATVQSVSSAGWGSLTDGLYRQTVTLPAALTSVSGTYDDYAIEIRDSSNGRKLLLQTEKVTSTTFYVWCNDNSISLKVIYT